MIDVKLVKEIRKITGAGFLDVKKALESSNNDKEKAIVWLRKNGIAKAAKKSGNIAVEGIVEIKQNDKNVVLYEVNSQTDFVAKNADFIELVDKIGSSLLENNVHNLEEVLQIKIDDNMTIQDLLNQAIAKIGEKILLRRFIKIDKSDNTNIGLYVHNNKRIGAIFVCEGGSEQMAKNVSMHIASMNPEYLNADQVPQNIKEEIKEEIKKSPQLLNKLEQVKNHIIQGMFNKKISEYTLVDQEFVMEKMKVIDYLKQNNAKEIAMYRFEVGEGINKNNVSFAEEVFKQIK